MAIGSQTFSGIGAGISDVASYFGTQIRGEFDIAEATSYDEAAQLALKNEQFTKMSTAIQENQADRELYTALGKEQQEVASAGFAGSGSALDIMRESAQQGALQKAVLGEQGLITEAGYQEQAQSYETMATAARSAAGAERIAGYLDLGAAAVSGISSFASLAPAS